MYLEELTECLLNHFLARLMGASRIPGSVGPMVGHGGFSAMVLCAGADALD